MSMRKQFVATLEKILEINQQTILLLGDIGVFGFNRAFSSFPNRVYNIGILEQATVGVAAGLAKSGFVPVVHTIAPFLVERSFEQIKIDFGYQKLGGNFVSVGASYDYASLGATHHCPGDVGLMLNIPGMEIVVPGTASEFDSLFKQAYANGYPTYFRLSERENSSAQIAQFGRANIIKKGSLATILVFGPMLDQVIAASESLDVTIIYYTTIMPFDENSLRRNLTSSKKVILVEPFYSGTMFHLVASALRGISVAMYSIGVPRKFLSNYGSAEEHDKAIGFTDIDMKKKIIEFLHD